MCDSVGYLQWILCVCACARRVRVRESVRESVRVRVRDCACARACVCVCMSVRVCAPRSVLVHRFLSLVRLPAIAVAADLEIVREGAATLALGIASRIFNALPALSIAVVPL